MEHAGPLMSVRLIGPTLARVRAAGGDADRLLRAFSLPATVETDAVAWLPLRVLRAFFEAAAEAAGDPDLGLHLVEELPHGRFGLLEYLCRSAPTVREAFRSVARYSALLNHVVRVTFEEHDGLGVVEGRIAGEPLCLGRHTNEHSVALLVLQTRRLAGADCVPLRAWFAHPRPSDTRELERLLGTSRLEFGREANGLALAKAVLDRPLATADSPLLELLDGQAQKALREGSGGDGFVGAVRQHVREHLSPAPPSLGQTARAMRASARTLQRRLGDAGTTFLALVESVRRELALLHVPDEARPLAEVAFLLGYSDPRALLRAFVRWTGQTPSQFRRALSPPTR
jgi:AraC-like DNA-binding protein